MNDKPIPATRDGKGKMGPPINHVVNEKIDAEEAIHRMNRLIDIYSKHGYMEEVMFRMAVGYCIDIIKQMAGENNDIGRVHNAAGENDDAGRLHKISGKRILRAKAEK